jgi:adenosylcobinamide-GDP ribazoletransferase
MSKGWNHFLTALMLLTRLPVGRWCRYSPEAVAASVCYFPLAGALVGAIGAAALWIALPVLPVKMAVLLGMLATVLVTGAFHEDGLADAADGLWGGDTTNRRLEIMKDSRLGSFGAIALWFTLAARFSLLESLVLKNLWTALAGGVAAHCLGRCAAVGVLNLLPHVGVDAGRAQPYCRRLSKPQMLAAFLPPALLVVAIFQTAAVPALAVTALLVFLSAEFFRRRIGGITGDCLGATVQITEIAVLGILATRL